MGGTGAIVAMMGKGGDMLATFASQQRNADALKSQADFEGQVAAMNAANAIARGQFDATQRQLQGRQAIGRDRAGAAASGIDPNSGTPLANQGQNAYFSELDAQTIKNNATRQAWGYTAQAEVDSDAAKNRADAERAQSFGTLLTGAAQTYGLYVDDRQANKFGGRKP